MTQLTQPRIPGGMIEWLPGWQRRFNEMLSVIGQTYEMYGFTPISTPALELTEVLLAKEGGETEKQVFRIEEEGMVLHFDLTVPLARYVAQYERELTFPFRRYQMQPVWRAEKPQHGRFREFYQCDFDVIGASSVQYDAEVPVIINDVLERLKLGAFTIRISNRKILNGLLEEIGCLNVAVDVLRIIDKLEKSDQIILSGALENCGLTIRQIDQLFAFLGITGTIAQIIAQLDSMPFDSQTFRKGTSELQTVVELACAAGVPEERIAVDLSIARGLDYYTGTVYETRMNDHPRIGSICSGGRFDNLARHYTTRDLPGVGASIGLTRLFWQLVNAELIKPSSSTPSQVMVAIIEQSAIKYGLSIAQSLRSQEIPTEVYLEPDRLGRQLQHAAKKDIRYAVIVGGNEMSSETVTLKDLSGNSAQQTIPRSEIVRTITQ